MRQIDLRNRAFFFITFLVLLILAIVMLRPFLSVIVLSLISIIILKPIYKRVLESKWVNNRARLAASLTLLGFFAVIMLPLYLISRVTIDQISVALADAAVMEFDGTFLEELDPASQAELRSFIADAIAVVAQALVSFGTSLINLFVQLIIYILIFVTLMPEFDKLVDEFTAISPLGSEVSTLYYQKTAAMISSLTTGIFLIALIQGGIMGFFFWLADLDLWFLLMLMAMFLAMVPVVGISYLTIFLAVLLITQDRTSDALIILFGFYGVANWVDLILRPRLVKKEAYMHFTLVLLGILGGVTWAGFLGLFYGPVIMLLLVTTIDIYREKFAKEDGVTLQDLLVVQRDQASPPGESETPP